MNVWVIAYRYDEDAFYDFDTDDTTGGLKPTCFLPTEDVANDYIRNELNDEYVAAKVTIHRVEENGVWAHSIDGIPEWEAL